MVMNMVIQHTVASFPVSVLALVIAIIAATDPCDQEYSVCTIENSTLPELCCLKDCCNVMSSCRGQLGRCVCHNQPQKRELHPLNVEYTTLRGTSVITGRVDIKSKLEQIDGYMSALPDNICHFQLLVKVDLRQNEIQEITNISCLINLDTLDLRWNQISYISNSTFQGLVSLRDLNLAHNRIRYIEPYSFSHQTSSILNIRLEDNDISDADITNIIINRPFCKINYTHNNIERIVNDGGWTLTAKDKIVDGGFIDLTRNNFPGVIDFISLGVTDFTLLGKIFDAHYFDMRDAPFQCDCRMQPFLETAEPNINSMWRSYYNEMKCFYPPQLQNQSIMELVRNKQLDLFICDIPNSEGCPYDCHCYEQPSKRRVVVNCTGHGIQKLPPHAPRQGVALEIYLNDNQISKFEWRNYLNHTRKIFLSNNSITTIEDLAVEDLRGNTTEVDLRGNKINDLPEQVRYFKPNTFIFGELNILCSCTNTWFGEWMTRYVNEKGDMNSFWCHTKTSVKELPELVTREFLNCDDQSMVYQWITIALALLTTIILGISLIVKLFKYEIYLLFRTFRNKQKTYPDMDYDVYISYDETDAEVNKWVMNILYPSLERDGYHVCIPARNFNVGVPYEEDITHFMGRSKFVLVVLSKNETCVLWDIGWKRAWFFYTSYKIQNIILVNSAMLEYDYVAHPILRAFLRLGMYLDFANMDKTLIIKVKKMLGCSARGKKRLESEFSNRNTMFNRHHMLINR